MDVKVLGTGCANCKSTMALIEQVARDKGVPIHLGKVEELRGIVGYGVMSTPGVVIDGQVVYPAGSRLSCGSPGPMGPLPQWVPEAADHRRRGDTLLLLPPGLLLRLRNVSLDRLGVL